MPLLEYSVNEIEKIGTIGGLFWKFLVTFLYGPPFDIATHESLIFPVSYKLMELSMCQLWHQDAKHSFWVLYRSCAGKDSPVARVEAYATDDGIFVDLRLNGSSLKLSWRWIWSGDCRLWQLQSVTKDSYRAAKIQENEMSDIRPSWIPACGRVRVLNWLKSWRHSWLSGYWCECQVSGRQFELL